MLSTTILSVFILLLAAKLNLIEGWKWTHKSFKGSAVYLWGEVGAAR